MWLYFWCRDAVGNITTEVLARVWLFFIAIVYLMLMRVRRPYRFASWKTYIGIQDLWTHWECGCYIFLEIVEILGAMECELISLYNWYVFYICYRERRVITLEFGHWEILWSFEKWTTPTTLRFFERPSVSDREIGPVNSSHQTNQIEH